MDQVQKIRAAEQSRTVVGLNAVAGKVLPRLDIDVMLLNQPKTFNLFILALQKLMKNADPQKELFEYFQIAGTFFRIHSMK